MSKSNISTQKVVFLLLAVILIALTYFLIYQKNMDKVRLTEANITKLETRIGQLADMEVQVREMEKTSDAKKTETEEYISQFAPLTTYEKTVYQVYQMMTATDLRVSSIDFGNYFVFLQGGMLYGEGQGTLPRPGGSAKPDAGPAGAFHRQRGTRCPAWRGNRRERRVLERLPHGGGKPGQRGYVP